MVYNNKSYSKIMSETDFILTESTSDSEFEEALEEVQRQISRDEQSDFIMEERRRLGLQSLFDGSDVKRWLEGSLELEDVVRCGRLKMQNSVLLGAPISAERVNEIREFARKIIDHYDESLRFRSYVDRVTACIIRHEYRL